MTYTRFKIGDTGSYSPYLSFFLESIFVRKKSLGIKSNTVISIGVVSLLRPKAENIIYH